MWVFFVAGGLSGAMAAMTPGQREAAALEAAGLNPSGSPARPAKRPRKGRGLASPFRAAEPGAAPSAGRNVLLWLCQVGHRPQRALPSEHLHVRAMVLAGCLSLIRLNAVHVFCCTGPWHSRNPRQHAPLRGQRRTTHDSWWTPGSEGCSA